MTPSDEGKSVKVFVSWSGERSRQVAEALRDWLPRVIQSIKPFMSASDIDIGSRWSAEIGTSLEEAHFGLICLTHDNLEAPWLLFEAGALSKFVENSRVVPYLYEITTAELQGPLAQFQAVVANKESTLEVLKSINGAAGVSGLDLAILEDSFGAWWPRLEEKFARIPESAPEAPPPRTDREILEEVLSLCRQMSRPSSPSLRARASLGRPHLSIDQNVESDDLPEDRSSGIAQSTREVLQGLDRSWTLTDTEREALLRYFNGSRLRESRSKRNARSDNNSDDETEE